MVLCRIATLVTWLLGTLVSASSTRRGSPLSLRQSNGTAQSLVTWDEHSLFIRGERLFFYSGEFHPFRLPVPGLWLDVFQKIKAMGFNGVSFYTDWGLLEGNPGHVVTDGIFALEPFFQAAAEAGIYLLARPGPYINAETAAGGFPGWTLRLNGTLRSTAPDFLNATQNYVATVGKLIADAQITNGGPVVLVQPENEYSAYPGVNASDFPNEMNREYMAFVEQQLRDAGIVVPFIDNDNLALGSFAPGTGLGAVDIYGIDAYPMRYDCEAGVLFLCDGSNHDQVQIHPSGRRIDFLAVGKHSTSKKARRLRSQFRNSKEAREHHGNSADHGIMLES